MLARIIHFFMFSYTNLLLYRCVNMMMLLFNNTAGITKQRMMDNGIGMDMVSLSQPPLHTAPLFIHKSTDSVFAPPNRDHQQHQGDTPLEDPRYEVPHWMNLSFATSPDKAKDAAVAAFDTLLPDGTVISNSDVSDAPQGVTRMAVTAAEKLDRKRERKQREEVRLPIPKLVNAPLFRPNAKGDVDVFSYLPTALAVLLNVNSGSNCSNNSNSSSSRAIGLEEVLQCTSSSTSRRNSGAAIVVPHAVTAQSNGNSSNSTSSTLTQQSAAQLLQELELEESGGASPVATAAAALKCLLQQQQQQDDSSRSSLSATITKPNGFSSSSSSGVLHMWGAAHQSPAGKLKSIYTYTFIS
jgi:Vacuolar membrane-associated protein Iml1